MATVRGTSAVLTMVVISLSACASATGALGPGPDTSSAAYQRGYQAGLDARELYGIRPGATVEDLVAFCDETAYRDIQPLKGAIVLWSEGFDAGCQTSLR